MVSGGDLVLFPTIHGKHELLADLFEQRLNWKFQVPNLNTDSFGTFAGEVPRVGTPLETVLAKARAGAEQSLHHLAIASEGTIGVHPSFPLVTTDHELMAFVDLSKGIELVESHLSAKIVAVREVWSSELDFDDLVSRAQLPSHGVIVRAQTHMGLAVEKGIHDPQHLREVLNDFSKNQELSEILIESDFRANHSPTRRSNILACAEKLVTRLESLCPNCQTRGWGLVDVVRGLPCELCGDEVERAPRAEIFGCLGCDFRVESAIGERYAKASNCDYCNP